MAASTPETLKRELGVFGATLMGLGSIIGTGIFVSIGIAAGVTGPSVVLAIVVAALVALCNALSSAQLAAAHSVSGGTYEYGYKFLHPSLGFTAGWMFLSAKSASAATAALGFAGYMIHLFRPDATAAIVPVAVATVIVLTVIVLAGVRRSNMANVVIVGFTLLALAAFVAFGIKPALDGSTTSTGSFFNSDNGNSIRSFLEACALMFVAYTGYGRIATMGEEVRQPRRTIPRAIVTTLIVSAILYIAVGGVAVLAVGADFLAEATAGEAAPLEIVAEEFGVPGLPVIIALAAGTAMLGVLLNLILGLSRVVLAMARRRDLPHGLALLNKSGTTPFSAVILVGVIILGLALIGDVATTWSFSAFTVLIYYAITNLSALRLRPEQRLFPRAFSWGGLIGCLGLAFWVEWRIWLVGLGIILIGLLWHFVAQRISEPDSQS